MDKVIEELRFILGITVRGHQNACHFYYLQPTKGPLMTFLLKFYCNKFSFCPSEMAFMEQIVNKLYLNPLVPLFLGWPCFLSSEGSPVLEFSDPGLTKAVCAPAPLPEAALSHQGHREWSCPLSIQDSIF